MKYILVLLFALFSFPAFGQSIGKIVTAIGAVTLERNGQTSTPITGDYIYEFDKLKTKDGKLQLSFNDGTLFDMSANAEMVIDKYVYDPIGSNNTTLFNFIKGAFTFVAGHIAKTGDMKVKTPVATMGIRGTTPRVVIHEDGSVSFATLIEEKKR